MKLLSSEDPEANRHALSLLALYALFIVYQLTHVPLAAYRTTFKFIAIKAVVIVLPPQQQLFEHDRKFKVIDCL